MPAARLASSSGCDTARFANSAFAPIPCSTTRALGVSTHVLTRKALRAAAGQRLLHHRPHVESVLWLLQFSLASGREAEAHGRQGDGRRIGLALPIRRQQLYEHCAIQIEGVRLHHCLAELLWRQHLRAGCCSRLPAASMSREVHGRQLLGITAAPGKVSRTCFLVLESSPWCKPPAGTARWPPTPPASCCAVLLSPPPSAVVHIEVTGGCR